MADQRRAAELAVQAFAAAHGVDADTVTVLNIQQERIPNPPLSPGQVSNNPVRYRFYVSLRSGAVSERLRVENGHVYRT